MAGLPLDVAVKVAQLKLRLEKEKLALRHSANPSNPQQNRAQPPQNQHQQHQQQQQNHHQQYQHQQQYQQHQPSQPVPPYSHDAAAASQLVASLTKRRALIKRLIEEELRHRAKTRVRQLNKLTKTALHALQEDHRKQQERRQERRLKRLSTQVDLLQTSWALGHQNQQQGTNRNSNSKRAAESDPKIDKHGRQTTQSSRHKRETSVDTTSPPEDELDFVDELEDVLGDSDSETDNEEQDGAQKNDATVTADDVTAKGDNGNAAYLAQVAKYMEGNWEHKRPKGLSKFRSIALVPVFLARTRRTVLWRTMTRKYSEIVRFRETIGLYVDLCRKWLRPCLKIPVSSVLKEPETDLSLSSGSGFLKHIRSVDTGARLMKIKVRVFSILQNMINTAQQKIPPSFHTFIPEYLASDGVYFPFEDDADEHHPGEAHGRNAILHGQYLFPVEIRALEFNEYRATVNMNAVRQRVLVLNFFVTRVLLHMVLRPWQVNIGQRARGLPLKNLRVLASVIHKATQTALAELLDVPVNSIGIIDPQLEDELLGDGDELFTHCTSVVYTCKDKLLEWVDLVMERVHCPTQDRFL